MIPNPVITPKFMTPALILASAAVLHEWLAGLRESVHSTMKQFALGKAFEGQHPQVTVLVPNASLDITGREGSASDA